MVPSGEYLARNANDHVRMRGIEQTQFLVGLRRCLLHSRERLDEHGELAKRNAGDREVLEGAKRLHAIERFVRHLTIAEQVVFDASASSTESKDATTAHQRRVCTAQSRRDRARRSRHEGGVELRCFPRDLVQLLAFEDHRSAGHDRPGRRPVR